MRRQGMLLNVGEVISGAVAKKTFELGFNLTSETNDEMTIVAPVTGEVDFIDLDGSVLGNFSVATTLELICSVDGEKFQMPTRLNFKHEFSKPPDEDASPVNPDNTVDVAKPIFDEIVISIPMKPLCPRHQE